MIYFEIYLLVSYLLCLILIRNVHNTTTPIATSCDLYSALFIFVLSPLMWWYPVCLKYDIRPENICKKLGNVLFGTKL